MRIVFGKIFTANPDTYIKEKLKRIISRNPELAARFDDTWIEAKAGSIIGSPGENPVPVALADSFYTITPEQQAEIEARKRCALSTLLRESPLLDGETVQEDFFTFLARPFGDLPSETAVLRRTTNKAEIFYLFDDVQVVKGDLQFVERVPDQLDQPVLALSEPITVKSIAKTLGEGLLSGFAGSVAALIFDAIFPPGMPDYFGEVFKEIRSIVKEELTLDAMAKINGRVNGVVAWSKNTYRPRKAAPEVPRKDLGDMVAPQVDLLYTEAVFTLMEERYAKPGLPAFMVAAGVHLALIQEQALVDQYQPDPNKSSFATTVRLNAQVYADHLINTFNAIVAERQKLIDVRYDPLVDQQPGDPYINIKKRYYYFDKLNNKQGPIREEYQDKDKKYHSGKEEADADYGRYVAGVISDLTASLGSPRVVANDWLRLKTQPIPALKN